MGCEPQPQCSSGSLRDALRWSQAMVSSPPFHPQNTVDKLIKKTNLALVIGTHSWREQFLEAVTVSAGKWGGRREEREGGMGRQSAGEEKREMNRKRERGARRRGQRTIEKRKRTRTQRKRKKQGKIGNRYKQERWTHTRREVQRITERDRDMERT